MERCMRRPLFSLLLLLLPKKRLTARVSLSVRPSVRVTLEASSYSQRQRGEGGVLMRLFPPRLIPY
jgi:hypothetical protein